MNPLISYFRKPAFHIAHPKHNTPAVNVTGTGSELFHAAAERVASAVCERAIAAHDHEAARHAWARLTRLIATRSPDTIRRMEARMGVGR
ncbi:hypothetical protein EAH75_01325 [Rhodanobacter glycinis]|nr:hypothetical protein EAH75_01325 [Rhodanobacter glycinis]